ncbi:hypothetical protein TURU_058044 [Turdus rufiventris]|nr:hypothetical protein TURU_058044 [Turdus rufiventris]
MAAGSAAPNAEAGQQEHKPVPPLVKSRRPRHQKSFHATSARRQRAMGQLPNTTKPWCGILWEEDSFHGCSPQA